ncbi:hypothetical protein M0657_011427 [Pyricularia oryzae]|uniref:PD-(D/E)XK nuclease-like domain-containing protein n=1 Tax=Pyricularia oryzae (strain Y34) TaxID=1143189 RepID=A0AA97NNB2_PYRO3|nr:hypothetical protein OOU_Y34scaffold00972g4 [Pyricularia oryzae Y34]KAI7910302.1 hypothetical protein M0657_011427 [Pyricularia oryzae]
MTATQAAAICTCNSCSFCSVFRWLNTIDHAVVGAQPTPPLLPHGRDPRFKLRKNPSGLTKRKRRSGLNTEALLPACAMPPSPPGSLPRSASPPKRRRVQEHDRDPVFDSDLTPRAIRGNDHPPSSSSANLNPSRAPFTLHPPAPPSSISLASRASTSTTISRNQSQSQRSTSPAKRTIDLLTLEKPIHIVPGNNSAKKLLELLPPDVHGLHTTLQSISGLVTPCIPGQVQEEVTGIEGPMSSAWFTPPGENDDKAIAIAELKTLDSICDDAFRLASQKAHEFEWNACVHLRMLVQATWLARSAVQYHVVNHVGIAPAFVPPVRGTFPDRGVLDTVIQQKKIDLALSLSPGRDSQLKEDILSAVIAQPLAERTVSQTMHDGLLFQPIAVAIETKTFQGDENYGLVQLGVWTAAWHVRMRKLMPPGHDKRLVTLPVLLVAHHNWSLFFACDRGDRIDMVPFGPIGGTWRLSETYKLLANLRALVGWVDGCFREWMVHFFADLRSQNEAASVL